MSPRLRKTAKRLHVYYSGVVQGVGFRYAVQDIASRLALTGWVKNLDDGRVEALAEGGAGELESFTGEVTRWMGRYIKDADIEWGEATGEFKGFDIRF